MRLNQYFQLRTKNLLRQTLRNRHHYKKMLQAREIHLLAVLRENQNDL